MKIGWGNLHWFRLGFKKKRANAEIYYSLEPHILVGNSKGDMVRNKKNGHSLTLDKKEDECVGFEQG